MTDIEAREIVNRLDQLREAMSRLAEKVERLDPRRHDLADPAHPNIVRVSGAQGGEPMIRGKQVTVAVVKALIRQGQTPEEIVKDYAGRLTLADIHDALSYYYDHQAEIEETLAAHNSALVEAAQWKRPARSGASA